MAAERENCELRSPTGRETDCCRERQSAESRAPSASHREGSQQESNQSHTTREQQRRTQKIRRCRLGRCGAHGGNELDSLNETCPSCSSTQLAHPLSLLSSCNFLSTHHANQVNHRGRAPQAEAREHEQHLRPQPLIKPVAGQPGKDHLQRYHHDPRRPLVGFGDRRSVVSGTGHLTAAMINVPRSAAAGNPPAKRCPGEMGVAPRPIGSKCSR
jgi:hypothetical protein